MAFGKMYTNGKGDENKSFVFSNGIALLVTFAMDKKNQLTQAEKIKPWAVVLALVIWQIVAVVINQRILIVSPITVVAKLWEIMRTADFWGAVSFSFVRIVGGFLLGLSCGVVLAVAASYFSFVRNFLAPFMLTIKSIPVVSFVILALIWFSSKNLAILISFLMVLPIVYTSTLEGIRHTDKNLLEMAQTFRITKVKKLRYIYFFEVFPFFVSGVKVALGLSWKSGIAAEVIGIPEHSIGENLFNAKIFLDTPSLFAWTIVIVIISALYEKLFLFLLSLLYKRLQRG